MENIGVYIHIPFCKQKCSYCDFTSFAYLEDKINEYIECLISEIKYKALKFGEISLPKIDTIYIGGGTPSYISAKSINKILNTIFLYFNTTKDCEISIEVNPGTVTREKLKSYRDFGINRLSIGLQTANDELLYQIGRIHKYRDYVKTINIAKETGFSNINTDLIIGIPNQTIYDVEDTLNKVIDMKIPHISVYSLIVEHGTLLERQIDSGKYKLVDDEIERYMYWFAKRKLEENLYWQYEISNFCMGDNFCMHNVNCWNQGEYLGFGLSSASYNNKIRYKNTDDINKYLRNIKNGNFKDNVIIEEKQDKESQMNEFMILGLRMNSGVIIQDFEEKFDVDPLKKYKSQLKKLLQEGLIDITDISICLSKKGLDLANIVWEEFV